MPRSRSRSRSRSRERRRHHRHDSPREKQRHRSRGKSPPPRSSKTTSADSKEQPKSQFPMKAADIKWGKPESSDSQQKAEETNQPKEKPNFLTSGKLLEDTNTFRGRVIKYNEPPEAMKPRKRWRFYPFKGDQQLPVMYVHRQSAYLVGSDRVVADFPVDHPSCSKQHAVLQYRLVPHTKPDGTNVRVVRPYIIDLESTNGTYLNGQRIEPRRYYELKEKDVLVFGFSTREYVLLHENTNTAELEDEFNEPEANPE